MDSWVNNLGRGNCQCKSSKVGQRALKGPGRLEGARERVRDEGREVTGSMQRSMEDLGFPE